MFICVEPSVSAGKEGGAEEGRVWVVECAFGEVEKIAQNYGVGGEETRRGMISISHAGI